MNKAFFLDRDGVIIIDKNYLSDPAHVEFFPDTVEALRLIRSHGYMIIGVSNQSGIARGYFTFDELKKIESHINQILHEHDVFIDAWYYCPHLSGEGLVPEYTKKCVCRKPEPGMILTAAKEYDVDLNMSAMIGDKISDVQAGKNAGCRTLGLVRTSKEMQDISRMENVVQADGLLETVKKILKILEN